MSGSKMTIIEAIKSGKRFKRPSFIHWMNGPNGRYGLAHGVMGGEKKKVEDDFYCLSPECVIANDWEIEETMIQITHSQFIEAFTRAYRLDVTKAEQPGSLIGAALAKELGF